MSYTLYFVDATATGSSAGTLSLNAPTDAATGTQFGLLESAPATPCNGLMIYGQNSDDSLFSAGSSLPTAALASGASDCLRTQAILSGTFASADWLLQINFRKEISQGILGCRTQCRLWRSVNADGSGATQITSAIVYGGNTTITASAGGSNITATASGLGSVVLTNEYLFMQITYGITTYANLGGFPISHCFLQVGAARSVLTLPNFTPSGGASTIGLSLDAMALKYPGSELFYLNIADFAGLAASGNTRVVQISPNVLSYDTGYRRITALIGRQVALGDIITA